MRFLLLVGCLSLTALAALVTVKLRSLNRKSTGFPPIHRNNVVQFRRSQLQKFLNRSGDMNTLWSRNPLHHETKGTGTVLGPTDVQTGRPRVIRHVHIPTDTL